MQHTKFIIDTVAKDGLRKDVMADIQTIAKWAEREQLGILEDVQILRGMGRSMTAVKKDLDKDGYTEQDTIVGYADTLMTAHAAVRDAGAKLVASLQHMHEVVRHYAAELADEEHGLLS